MINLYKLHKKARLSSITCHQDKDMEIYRGYAISSKPELFQSRIEIDTYLKYRHLLKDDKIIKPYMI